MKQIVEHSREGTILTSIPPIGPIQAAAILASIGHIANARERSQTQILLRAGSCERADWCFLRQSTSHPARKPFDETHDVFDCVAGYSDEGHRVSQAL